MSRTRRRRKRRKSAARRAVRPPEDYASLVRPDAAGLPFTLHAEADSADGAGPPPGPGRDRSPPAAPGGSSSDPPPGPEQEPDPDRAEADLEDPTAEQLLLNAARGAAMRGETNRALAIYRELLTEHPGHTEGRRAFALLLEQQGRPDEALEHLDRCLGEAGEDARLLTDRGAVLCGIRRFDDAESDLARALQLEPSSVDTHFHFGVLQSRRGLWADALPFLRRSVELDPGCAAAYLHLGDALNHIDDLPGALQAYQRCVELGPTNAKALYGLGVVYDRLNQPEEAAAMYRRSRELAGT